MDRKKYIWGFMALLIIAMIPALSLADTKISELPAATAITSDDLLVIVDDPSGTPVTQKITWASIIAAIVAASLTSTATMSMLGTVSLTASITAASVTPGSVVMDSWTVSAFRTSILADLSNVFFDLGVFADYAVPSPPASPFKVILDAPYRGIGGDGGIIESTDPTALAISTDLAGYSIGDSLIIKRKSYKIAGMEPTIDGDVTLIVLSEHTDG